MKKIKLLTSLSAAAALGGGAIAATSCTWSYKKIEDGDNPDEGRLEFFSFQEDKAYGYNHFVNDVKLTIHETNHDEIKSFVLNQVKAGHLVDGDIAWYADHDPSYFENFHSIYTWSTTYGDDPTINFTAKIVGGEEGTWDDDYAITIHKKTGVVEFKHPTTSFKVANYSSMTVTTDEGNIETYLIYCDDGGEVGSGMSLAIEDFPNITLVPQN